MNKGIRIASGNVTGTLNADDFFAADDILENVAATFANTGVDILYGDLDYINQDETICSDCIIDYTPSIADHMTYMGLDWTTLTKNA